MSLRANLIEQDFVSTIKDQVYQEEKINELNNRLVSIMRSKGEMKEKIAVSTVNALNKIAADRLSYESRNISAGTFISRTINNINIIERNQDTKHGLVATAAIGGGIIAFVKTTLWNRLMMYYKLSVGGTKIIIEAVADHGFVSSACATWDSEKITTDIGKDPIKIAKKAFLQKLKNPLLLEPDYEEYSKYYYLTKGVEQSLPEEEVPQIEAPELLQIGYDESKYQQGWLESAQNLIGMISVSKAVKTITENAPGIGKIIGKGTCKVLTSSVGRSQTRQNLERGLNQVVETASSAGFFMGNLIYLAIICGIMYIIYRTISSQTRKRTLRQAREGKLLGEGSTEQQYIENVNFSNVLRFCGFSNTKKKLKSKSKKRKSKKRSKVKRKSKKRSKVKRKSKKRSKVKRKSKRRRSKRRSRK